MDTKVIHIVLGKANPARMNGVNKVVHELATHQVLAGWDVEVWGITRDLHSETPSREYSLRLFQAYRNLYKVDSNLVEALVSEHSKNNIIVHLHGGFIPTFFTLAKSLVKNTIPYVFTPHGSYNEIALRRSFYLKKIYLKIFEKNLAQNAQYVHCLGKSEVIGTKKLFKNANTCLIPYGFNLIEEVYKREPQPDKFIIGFCGRMDAYTKGLDALTEGFLKFSNENPNAELWLIGDGQDLQSLKKEIAPFGNGKVIFHGSKYGEEKFNLLSQLDVFAHPSRNEGLPTAVLEAASLGIPTLITEATNLGDAVRNYNCGFVMEQTKGIELYEGLNILKQELSTKKDEVKANARKMVTETFNWFTLLNGYAKMYTADNAEAA
ncbi:glycosyltransferase family 4 protein [Fulvivirga maritima]|uniref:glycosyltransferase family 4 protein n=1 Tax=Fulvivirga maritima TaxID=2904247 RepID=UPI001F3D169B|nr:glycosyltransferase family 4 protein [Fulvivirga maritima]UII28910.1 glycosyltransferase family 4 protein [Fulvivirga maritima]